MGVKKWYKSKTIWAGVVAVGVAVYNALSGALAAQCNIAGSICAHLPAIPQWVYGILGAFGIYGRVKADSKIG